MCGDRRRYLVLASPLWARLTCWPLQYNWRLYKYIRQHLLLSHCTDSAPQHWNCLFLSAKDGRWHRKKNIEPLTIQCSTSVTTCVICNMIIKEGSNAGVGGLLIWMICCHFLPMKKLPSLLLKVNYQYSTSHIEYNARINMIKLKGVLMFDQWGPISRMKECCASADELLCLCNQWRRVRTV